MMEAPSRIPRLQRSASFHGRVKRNNNERTAEMDDEDLEAEDDITSLSSVCSVVSCSLPGNSYRRALESASDHRGGGGGHKSSKFTLHCSTPSGSDQYLTPTQRANRTIRRLKSLLKESEDEARYKDFEIQRLTKELVELRLEHAQCVRKAADEADPIISISHLGAAPPSLADSGLFDEMTHLNHSKESLLDRDVDPSPWSQRRTVNSHADQQMADLKRQYADEVQNIRSRLTDRLEQALGQLGDSNARYASLLSSYDLNREELKRAEAELKLLRQKIAQNENALAQFQSDMDERETREYEIREKEITQIEILTNELSQKNEMISALQSKLEKIQNAQDQQSGCQSLNQHVDQPTADEVVVQLSSATAQLEKIKVVQNSAVAWISGADAVALWFNHQRNSRIPKSKSVGEMKPANRRIPL